MVIGEQVLVVCTANRCRSPLAAAMLAARLEQAGEDCVVASAGFLPGGEPVPDELVMVADQWGLELGGHQSRQVDPDLVRGSDLIVGMERQHVRELAMMVPERWRCTFTLPELARRSSEVITRPDGDSLVGWLAVVAGDRRLADLLGEDLDDDVRDPMGGPLEGYRRMADELDQLTAVVVANLWPAAAPAPARDTFRPSPRPTRPSRR